MFSFIKKATILHAVSAAAIFAQVDYPTTPPELAGIKNLGTGINTPNSEYTPFVTPDEKYLFFQSNREPSAGPEGDADIWYSKNNAKNRGVDEPVFDLAANVGLPVSSVSLDGQPSLRKLPNGEHEMYFASFASANRLGPQLTNIYYAAWRGGKWTDPVSVAEINTDYHDRMPSISEDGKFLFFSSDRPGGKGGDDIWVSELNTATNKWGPPVNVASVNTAASEITPALHSDGTTLYFSSNRAGGVGGSDIYFTQSVSRLADPDSADMLGQGFTPPKNLGKPFNSEFDDESPSVIASGERIYFSSDRHDGFGSFDIYRATVPAFARPVMRIVYKGKTLSGLGKKIVPAKIDIVSGVFKTHAETNIERDGAYGVNLASRKEYEVAVTAPGYRAIKEKIDARDLRESKTIEKDFRLVRDIALPASVKLEIQFVDEKGQAVSPQAKVKIAPVAKKTKALKVAKGKALLPLISKADFKSEDEAIAALDGYVLEVQAKKKGLPSLDTAKALSEVLDQYTGKLPEVIPLKFTMGDKNAEAVKPKPVEEAVAKPEKPEKAPEEKKAADKTALKFLGRLYFATNVADKITGDDERFLRSVAKRMKSNPGKKLVIIGHSDSRGTKPYNKKLAQRRANYAKKLLVAKGVPAKDIEVKSAGNSRRRYVNDNTETKRQKNRRADIYISIAVVEEEAAAPKKTEASPTAAEKKEEAPAAAKPDKPDAVQPADGGEKPN
ncbi:MAG: PD40 domain-containing protein [Turneriella sp.]|nr:PD40 domain-containing protein [Turneriella sp.]